MPAVSQAQQQAAGAALAAKRGGKGKAGLKGASKEMYNMPEDELEKFAGTSHKGLPKHVEEQLREYIRKTIRETLNEDDKWIQKAVNPEHKGYCTPMSKSTCTPRRKALAKRFKKGIEDEGKQEMKSENLLRNYVREAITEILGEAQGGYIELLLQDPVFVQSMKLLEKAWDRYTDGPETTPEDLESAKQAIIDYILERL